MGHWKIFWLDKLIRVEPSWLDTAGFTGEGEREEIRKGGRGQGTEGQRKGEKRAKYCLFLTMCYFEAPGLLSKIFSLIKLPSLRYFVLVTQNRLVQLLTQDLEISGSYYKFIYSFPSSVLFQLHSNKKPFIEPNITHTVCFMVVFNSQWIKLPVNLLFSIYDVSY